MCGLLIILNLLLLAFIFLSLDTDHGSCAAPLSWMTWRANCQICQGMLSIGEGIFCANFSTKRGPWTPCHRAWHGRCYCTTDNGEFPIAKPQDEAGEFMIQDSEDEERFLVARDGGNLVTPFQCDFCHFVNIMGQEPLEGLASDVRLLKCIHRINLDAFWAREPGTIRGVLDEAKRGIAIASALGFAQTLFWPRGPFPPTDTMGVGIAGIIVQRSLDKGRYSDNVQYETVQKFQVAASNIYHSSVDGQGAMVMAKDTRKLQVTKCPTYSNFFERFNRGLHKRMGDIVGPDRAIAHAIVKELMEAVEQDWIRASDAARLNLALEGAFYVLAFTLALRVEEIPLIELRGIHRNWNHGMQHAKHHVVITLLGRF
jgi:hypothetical protein